jgi:16S rRNA G966 N2-methylase RsmD
MYRFRSQGGSLGAGGGPMNGTLYVPSLSKEIPVLKMLEEHIKKAAKMRSLVPSRRPNIVGTISHVDLTSIPSCSVDYIFTDPPFGGNLMYSELNFIWESWLRIRTNIDT